MRNVSLINRIFTVMICLLAGAGVCIAFERWEKIVLYALVILSGILILSLRQKHKLTIYHWFIIFFAVMPLHSVRLGSDKMFVRFTEVVFIPLLLWWIVRRKISPQHRVLKIPAEYLLMAAFFVFSFMSAIVKSLNPFSSIMRTGLLAYLVLLSYIYAEVINDFHKVKYFLKVILIISAITGGIAVFQSLFPQISPIGVWLSFTHVGPIAVARAAVGWSNPGYYGLYLIGIIPVSISLLLSNQFPYENSFIKKCLFFQTLGLISTYSRGALVGIIASLLFLLWAYGRKRLAIFLLIGLVLVGLIMTMGMDFIYQKSLYLAAYLFRIGDPQWLKDDPSLFLGHRIEAWQVYWRMFLDNRILGLGPFDARAHYFEYLGNDLPDRNWPIAPHSEYLSILAERGLLGIIPFFIFLGVLLNRAHHFVIRFPRTQQCAIVVGISASIIGFLVFSIAGASIYDIQFWLNVGMLIGITTLPVVGMVNNPEGIEQGGVRRETV